MATKAQKRAAGEARAKLALQESIESGLRAQREDNDRRAKKQQEIMAKKAANEESTRRRETIETIVQIAETLERAKAS